MTIGLLKEELPERRVALLPEHVKALKSQGITVIVESGSGEAAFASDEQYREAGAEIKSRQEVVSNAEMLLTINLPKGEIGSGKTVLGNFGALSSTERFGAFADKQINLISLDMLPRTTRAQSMDVLSSQANIAGYRAVLVAAANYSRYLPMFMTAAGSIAPAKFLIIGAGVAGLQAIATAKRLGAVVEVFDTRPAVKEEVMSLGAKFIEVEGAADASAAGGYAVQQSEEYQQRQKEKIAASVAKSDIIITTAQIPGKKAPILITEEMIASMRKGSVIVDLAAATGGNTPFSKQGETVTQNGVSIIGDSNLSAGMSSDASKLYGKNLMNFLQLILKDGQLNLNFDDDLVKGATIIHKGEIVNERLAASMK